MTNDFVFTRKRLRRAVLYIPSIGLDADWLKQQNITPIGTSQDANELFWNCQDGICHDPNKDVPLESVLGFHEATEALRKLPNSLLQAFKNQKDGGPTEIYFSTQNGRSVAVIGYSCYLMILEQTINEKTMLHEYAHVIDVIGIRGMEFGYDYPPIWNLADQVNQIFDAKGDLITSYARENTFEDFAEHFCYYVWKGTTFRTKALTNPDLAERYDFLKEYLFQGIEYEEPPPPPVTLLEGYVINDRDCPLAGADVLAKSVTVNPCYIAVTDSSGYFIVEEMLPEGEYVVWAQMQGVKGEEVTVYLSAGVPVNVTLVVKWQEWQDFSWLIPVAIISSVVVIVGITYLLRKKSKAM